MQKLFLLLTSKATKLTKKAIFNQLQADNDERTEKLIDTIFDFIEKQKNQNYNKKELIQLFITKKLSIHGTMIKLFPENF